MNGSKHDCNPQKLQYNCYNSSYCGYVSISYVDLHPEALLSQDFPLIRVAWSESGQRWYSADNRRLFIFKAGDHGDHGGGDVVFVQRYGRFSTQFMASWMFSSVWKLRLITMKLGKMTLPFYPIINNFATCIRFCRSNLLQVNMLCAGPGRWPDWTPFDHCCRTSLVDLITQ